MEPQIKLCIKQTTAELGKLKLIAIFSLELDGIMFVSLTFKGMLLNCIEMALK